MKRLSYIQDARCLKVNNYSRDVQHNVELCMTYDVILNPELRLTGARAYEEAS